VATFSLVHGAWHGAWCWESLVPELERGGHRVIAVDLPCEDPDATLSDYADVVVESLEGVDDVVLVAHSLGGQTAPLVAARRPVQRLVYLCALLVDPGRSLLDQLGDEPEMLLPRYRDGLGTDAQGRSCFVDFEVAREAFFADCDEDVARSAYERLRCQGQTAHGLPCPLDAHPDVPTEYVVGSADGIVNPAWSRRAARERLGVEPIEIAGSSHSPFLSRPAELAALLTR
jgi:pimeloyl-ACP methyl ester carboxylesterase